MSKASRILRFHLPMVFTLALGFWSIGSYGQDDLGSDVTPDSGQVSKGKPSDPHQMKFKFVDEEEEKKKAAAARAEKAQEQQKDAEEFKTYVGYPKHQFGAHIVPTRVASAWTTSGQTYNFVSNTIAYGLDYNFIITPRLTIGLDYTHYALKMNDATANANTFQGSTANFDDYFAKVRYCFISDENFDRRFCPGIDIGNDSYPVPQYLSGTVLGISNVTDFTIGVNATGVWPVKSIFLLKGIAGYNMGLGGGSSGSMSSKNDASYYFDLITDWKVGHNADFQQGIQIGMGIKFRDAKLSGTEAGGQAVTWDSSVVEEDAYAGYTITF